MDLLGIAAIITALGGTGGIAAIWKAAKRAAKNELLTEGLQELNANLERENERLWKLLDTLTTPEVGS